MAPPETRESKSIEKGTRTGRISSTAIAVVVIIVLAAVGVGAYIAFTPSSRIIVEIDGSSTVFPITSAWAAEFSNNQRQVLVAQSGTGGGFQKFCRGETDLNDASRPIKKADSDPATTTEEELCTQNGFTGIVQFKIAYDGLSIVLHKDNNWAPSFTVGELCRIWTSNLTASACKGQGPQVNRWNELNASWPNQKIELYGPGTDSGTFDYFWEKILNNTKSEHREDFTKSEDDNVLVQGCANNIYAMCYFGYAYVDANRGLIKAAAVDDGKPDSNGDSFPDDGPIAPTEQSIKDGSYAPLSRPLFIYGNAQSLARQVVEDFIRFGFTTRGMELVRGTGYVDLTSAEIATELLKLG
jgi:phosphate transport system substrate-binding protein